MVGEVRDFCGAVYGRGLCSGGVDGVVALGDDDATLGDERVRRCGKGLALTENRWKKAWAGIFRGFGRGVYFARP
jgi:hypothetical protein